MGFPAEEVATMKKCLGIAVLLLASSFTAAQAQYTFEYGGRTITIDPDRGTVQIPGVYDNTGKKARRPRGEEGDLDRPTRKAPQQAKSAPQTAPEAAAPAAPAAPAPAPAEQATAPAAAPAPPPGLPLPRPGQNGPPPGRPPPPLPHPPRGGATRPPRRCPCRRLRALPHPPPLPLNPPPPPPPRLPPLPRQPPHRRNRNRP